MIDVCSFNVHGYKSSSCLVEEIVKNNCVTFLIEHWLAREEEHLLKSVSPNHMILFDSEFSDCEYRRGRPFGGIGVRRLGCGMI